MRRNLQVRFEEIKVEIFSRPTMTERLSQAEKRLQADILPAVWARAQIAGKIAEEEEVRRELDELRKEEARQKLRDESELVSDGQPDKLGRLHDMMNRRGEGPSREREKIFAEIYRQEHPPKKRPGWGKYGNQTREQVIEKAVNLVRDSGAAALDGPLSTILPEYFQAILADEEQG